MAQKAQILTVVLIALLVLAVVSVIGISSVINKEIYLSNFVKRATDWFSSTISSLEYGLYQLNLQTVPAGQEIALPYFGEENLLPFFRAPFTITIYGEQVLPAIYEGYFGFRDLLYPISWIFKWLVVRKEGAISQIDITPGNINELVGQYYVQNNNSNSAGSFVPYLNDGFLSPTVLIGDDPGTSNLDDYVIIFSMSSIKYVDFVKLYISPSNITLQCGSYCVEVYYFDNLAQQFVSVASTDVVGQFVNLSIKRNTDRIMIRTSAVVSGSYALISEARFYGY